MPDGHHGHDDGPDKIPNPYLAALRAARSSAKPHRDPLLNALDGAVRSMETVMTGSAFATDLMAELKSRRRQCRTGAHAISQFDRAISAEPEKVSPDSWQAHWQQRLRIAPRPGL